MNALPARAAGIPAGFLDQTASDRTSRATRILHAADQITPFLERDRPIGANARERALQRPARQNGIPGELVEASLNRYLVPALGSRSIHHVTDTDIANITNKIVAGGHPQAANTAFWYMRAFFNWCRKPPQRLIAVSPRGIGKSGIRPRSSSASEW
ncbi:hypothetical protein [Mesorhizobium sp.]|uniref:hypothetical protein n=1 Tax=Mesorhizobium sp. TaxID=1871066 RepID=UPI0011FA0237|nr:hypothetical protein [Mesorhizobium sp.]TIM37552.1 MAG: hypothetical protein E5Y56_33305 [Mesorhizobium sp.]